MKRILIALLAFSVLGGGTAIAAKKYVITSKKQIAPKVRKQLKGKRGPTGPVGPAGIDGAKGSDGAAGPTGPEGPEGQRGPSSAALDTTDGSFQGLASNGSPTNLAQVTVPAGSHTINGVGRIFAQNTGSAKARCNVFRSDTGELVSEGREWVSAANPETSIPVVGAITTTEEVTVTLYCNQSDRSDGATLTVAAYGELVTTQVAELDLPPED